MAKLSETAYTFTSKPGDWDALSAELDVLTSASDALEPGKLVGGILSFPIADGNALYRVTSEKPLTVQHVPFGDAYSVHPALIRGLTKTEVAQMLERAALWRKAVPVFKPVR